VVNRRQIIAGAVVATVGVVGWRFVLSSDESAIVAVLRKRLDYLLLDNQGLHDYARDLVAEKIVSSGRLRFLDVAGPIYTHLAAPDYRNALTRELRHGEERVVSQYLLSSDFFPNADESKLVRYRKYYNPLRDPLFCNNPFARSLTT